MPSKNGRIFSFGRSDEKVKTLKDRLEYIERKLAEKEVRHQAAEADLIAATKKLAAAQEKLRQLGIGPVKPLSKSPVSVPKPLVSFDKPPLPFAEPPPPSFGLPPASVGKTPVFPPFGATVMAKVERDGANRSGQPHPLQAHPPQATGMVAQGGVGSLQHRMQYARNRAGPNPTYKGRMNVATWDELFPDQI